MAKIPYVVANWKMFKTSREATHYIEELVPLLPKDSFHLYLAVPFTTIASAARFAKDTSIRIGAQNMHDAREGAFTGEIAALMLKEAGASFVLLGHSERRHHFGEEEAFIARKVARALADDIEPILCVGETLEERDHSKEIVERQLRSALEHIPAEDVGALKIAYEPVWAIGTGKHATPNIAEEAHAFCREVLGTLFGEEKAKKIPILYGGSVNQENVHSFLQEPNIDGVLVGGASLDPNHLANIVHRL